MHGDFIPHEVLVLTAGLIVMLVANAVLLRIGLARCGGSPGP